MDAELIERIVSAVENVAKALHTHNELERERLDKMFPPRHRQESKIGKAHYRTEQDREEAEDGFERFTGVGPRERAFLESQDAGERPAPPGRPPKGGSKP